MLNLRQLTRPNPSDSNLHPRGEPLGMTKQSYSTYYHNTHKHTSNAHFGRLYNTTSGTMGTLDVNQDIRSASGIHALREPKHAPKSNNPLFNALVNAPHYPKISQLVDARLTLPNPLIQTPTAPI